MPWTLGLLGLPLAAGCGGDPGRDAPAPVDPDQAIARAEALVQQQHAEQAQAELAAVAETDGPSVERGAGAQISDAPPVPVVLVWEGVGHLHKGFFSDGALTTGLSADLAGTLAPPANVYVRYDSKEFVGSIRVQLLPGSLKLDVAHDGDTLRLQALSPITRALASYRTGVASSYDLRVDSFSVGIESFRGGHGCIFTVAGTPPPDGSVVSPCVDVDGQRRCGEPSDQGVRFPPDVARILRRCLDL